MKEADRIYREFERIRLGTAPSSHLQFPRQIVLSDVSSSLGTNAAADSWRLASILFLLAGKLTSAWMCFHHPGRVDKALPRLRTSAGQSPTKVFKTEKWAELLRKVSRNVLRAD